MLAKTKIQNNSSRGNADKGSGSAVKDRHHTGALHFKDDTGVDSIVIQNSMTIENKVNQDLDEDVDGEEEEEHSQILFQHQDATSARKRSSLGSVESDEALRTKRPRILHPIWEYCAEPHPQFPESRVICKFCQVSLRLPYGYKLERLREHFGLNAQYVREGKRGKGCTHNPFQPNEFSPFSPSPHENNYLDWKDHVAVPSTGQKIELSTSGSQVGGAADSDSEGGGGGGNGEVRNYSSENNLHIQHQAKTNSTTNLLQSTTNHSHRLRKRPNVLSWDDYFMAISFLSAQRSKDPNTQVGACIVNPEQRIVGIGYNGFPRGCSDDELPWDREADNELDTKYPYVCHAEVNAILNKNSSDLKNCKIYVALFPCNECCKVIIQSGIQEVIYMSDKYSDTPSMIASRRMFGMAKVRVRQFTPTQNTVNINFNQAS